MSELRNLYPEVKKILLDANILVILIASKVRPELLERLSPGNRRFAMEDIERLEKVLSKYPIVVTTPYVLTEVNSLINSRVDKNSAVECRAFLAQAIASLENHYVEPSVLSADPDFTTYGIADISIRYAIVKEDTLVLSEDNPLRGLLRDRYILSYFDLKDILSGLQ